MSVQSSAVVEGVSIWLSIRADKRDGGVHPVEAAPESHTLPDEAADVVDAVDADTGEPVEPVEAGEPTDR